MGIKEECAIFGIIGKPEKEFDPALITYTGLFSLQHRGQEAAGIAVNDKGIIKTHKGPGLLTDVFDEKIISKMKGTTAVGHTRYSTTGDSQIENAQPISVTHIKGNLSVVHNGNLTNAGELREEIERGGGIFHSTSDSEVIAYEIVRQRINSKSIEEAVQKAMHIIKGAYSIILMSPKKLIAARDPFGFRPLVIGKMDEGQFVFASETCALDTIGATYIRDVNPGEIVMSEKGGDLISIETGLSEEMKLCSFEYIYFSRPDSVLQGFGIDESRRIMGKYLARKAKLNADIVVAVPDSGISAANGFAEEAGIPLQTGLIKNRYVARTFIAPLQKEREQKVKLKLNPLRQSIFGKRVVLVDDSIVRGTTSKAIVAEIRKAGAKEVHFVSSSPPFRNPCYFGTDVPDTKLLFANNIKEKDWTKYLGVESLTYLDLEDLREIFKERKIGICDGCFSGEYPLTPQENKKNKFFNQY